MPNTDPNIAVLVAAFARQITAIVEATMTKRMQAALATAFGTPAKRGPGRPPKQFAAPARPMASKRKKKASPKVAWARKLQGQYLGALKSLTGSARAKVKAMAKEKGVAEAVKLALGIRKKA
jgi:hypothetical protein